MVFFLLIFIFIIIKNTEYNPKEARIGYCTKSTTNGIKGIFIIMVLFGHYTQYVTMDSAFDLPYMEVYTHLDQMVVAMFLFYSGYGVMESIKAKGKTYINSIPTKRVLSVLINFDIAVILYAVVCFVIHRDFSIGDFFFSLIAWRSLGNSNWYIFIILMLYALTYISFMVVCCKSVKQRQLFFGVVVLTIFTMVLIFWLMKMDMDWYWYDTAILYPGGCFFSLLKRRIDATIYKSSIIYSGVAVITLLIYYVSFQNRWDYGIEGYTVWAFSFVAVVILFTMKFVISSRLLEWFGTHLFSVFILQRIPMIIMAQLSRQKIEVFIMN